MLNQFVVSFEVETNRLVGSQTSLDIGAGASSNLYPSDLPIPIMEGFSASHGARNVTTYSLLYRMSTNLLKQWNYFAAFKGTAWFMSPMVSPNVPCGREWIRYISNPEVRLIRPNVFEVSIQAESMPSAYSIEGVTAPGGGLPIYPPISGCTYDDSLIKYDENGHPYECGTGGGGGGGGGGGVATPTNDFVVPASRMIVSASMQGTAPVTVTSKISFMRTGAVLLVDSVSPAWTTWYSIAVPDGTLKPLWLTIPSGVEYSLEDGTNTWQTSAGFEYQLNGADLGISLRFAHTTSVSETVMSQVFPYQFLRNDIKGVKEVVANFEIGHQVNAIITTVTPPASPFVANFGMVGSRVRTPWHDEARSSVRITNWNNAGYRGALIADNILTLGDGVTQSVTYWIDPVMSGGAGTYTIQVLNVVGNMSPGAGTYSLPFDFSEVEFSLSALGSGPTNGTIETATADIKIYKNGTLVSEGSISLRSDSRGVIV
jgi:hypothetical protein